MTDGDMRLIIEVIMWLGGISLIFSTVLALMCYGIKEFIKWILNRVAAIRQVH